MGCDIHFHIEVKMNGKWEHYGAPDIGRWYELFSILAGVRGSGKPIVYPKGFPKDASVITKIDYDLWGRDAHTPSWLNSNEILKLEKWLEKRKEESISNPDTNEWADYDLEYGILKTYFFGHSFTSWKKYDDIEYKPKEIEDVRFVFWFDN
jgi:hypothetical protein